MAARREVVEVVSPQENQVLAVLDDGSVYVGRVSARGVEEWEETKPVPETVADEGKPQGGTFGT